MIVREFYKTRADGVNLYKIYSDKTKYILQEDTGLIYNLAIDTEHSTHTYTETDSDIPKYSPTDAELRVRTTDLESAVMELAAIITEGGAE